MGPVVAAEAEAEVVTPVVAAVLVAAAALVAAVASVVLGERALLPRTAALWVP
jgi:hypothetical protein